MTIDRDEEIRQLRASRRAVVAGNASRMLVHYMQTAWKAAGLTWDSDHDAEIELIVDLIIEAADER